METILNQEILEQVNQLQQQQQYNAALDQLREYVDNGLKNGTFTRIQARKDLQLALKVAEIDLEMDEYEAYVQATQWLYRAEEKAQDCGLWFYRYAKACMYTNRLPRALELAERAILLMQQDPQALALAAKLRAHFGKMEGALQAVQQALELCPQDERLLHLQSQIMQGADLEAMELPPCDTQEEKKRQTKQRWGECPAKSRSILCILKDEENFQKVKQALQPTNWMWEMFACFCTFTYDDRDLECRFDMNEAGVSKFSPGWIADLLENLPQMDDLAKQMVRSEHTGLRLELEHLVVERTGHVKLGYHVGCSREERLFAYLKFDCDFVPQGQLDYEDYSEEPPQEEQPQPTEQQEQEEEQYEEPAHHYEPAQAVCVQQHIRTVFGQAEQMLQGCNTPFSMEICVIPPTPQKNYYTLVTLGMGSYSMAVPPELESYHVDRIELVMYLPPDWPLEQQEQRWQWPLQCLRHLAQLPAQKKTWLGWGNTVHNGAPFAVDTDLSSSILIRPQQIEPQQAVCSLPDGNEVNFYQVMPLYNEELEYKNQHGADILLELLHQTGVCQQVYLQPQRPNACGQTVRYSQQQIEFMEQLENWHQKDQHEQIVQAIEQLEPSQQNYRILCLQARALNNLDCYQQAVDLLQSVKEQGESDPLWHFRLGYAYYYMGMEQQAIKAFTRSEELDPGNEDIQLFLHWCRSAVALPVTVWPFEERVKDYWSAFVQQEQQLRLWMEQNEWEKAHQAHTQLLEIAFSDKVAFTVSYQQGCHRLTLLGQGITSRLLQYSYWQNNAPESLWKDWEFVVGAAPAATNQIMVQDLTFTLTDVSVWPQDQQNGRISLELYEPQLSQLKDVDPDRAMAVVKELLEQALGEIAYLACVAWVDVLEQPKDNAQYRLDGLLQYLADVVVQGNKEALQDPELLQANYLGYRYNPTQTDEWVLRQDVIVGSSCCNTLVRAYYQDDEQWMDLHQKDGMVCGFLFYSNDGLEAQRLVQLRAQLEDVLKQQTQNYAMILGGAIGFKYSYIDCMCFDIKRFLNTASQLLNQYEMEEIGFHVFRVDCGGVNLKNDME